MKTLIFILMMTAVPAFPQGFVLFQNDGGTRLTTNDFLGNMGFTSGVNAYRIGLYIAPAGTMDEFSFSLAGLATNQSGGPLFDGRFNGGDRFRIAGNTGQTIAFQIRSWSFFAGNSYEEALLYAGTETVYAGKSIIGEVIPGTGSALSPPLFGTGPGQVLAFTLTPYGIPEPSTVALAVVGAGVLWFATRARRRKSCALRGTGKG